jgi:heparan-alpha-glucosaminide N-acetyltransferase
MNTLRVEGSVAGPAAGRLMSIDALRGLVMLLMIFVNDLIDVPGKIVPPWLQHYNGPDGMTFVDAVFPAFLFIVGMSIPFALGARINKGEPRWRTFLHVVTRTLSLLLIGILMVNGTPDSAKMGWSGDWWSTLMFLCAICAFCVITPAKEQRKKLFRIISLALRLTGFAGLIFLAFAFRNKNGHPMITLWPFYIHHIWYGILGYIGWAYLMSALVFLIFRTNLTALLGCAVLMMCLYPANKLGLFNGLWIATHVNIGIALGSRAAITATGLLLGTMLLSSPARAIWPRVRFTLLLTAGCAAAAWLLNGLYGTSKENATPSWALWGCAITAALWLVFYFISDVHPVGIIAKPLAIAGQNVLLPYLISEMLPSVLAVAGLDTWYESLSQPTLPHAITRAASCAVVIMCLTTGLNRLSFRLKL